MRPAGRALFDRYGTDCVDAVYIDTEGHDARVLAQLDLPRFRPKAVLYEHKQLSTTKTLLVVAID